LTGGRSELPVYLLDAAIEEAIRHAITRTGAGSFLTRPRSRSRRRRAIRRALRPALPRDRAERVRQNQVVLTQPDIRRFVRKLIEVDLPDIAVVSFAELCRISLRPVAKATLAVA
jgi:type III secretion protein V